MVGTLGPGVGYGKASRFMYIATAGQVTFNGADSSAQALTLGYTPNYVEVIVNGVWLPPQDYTATNGSSIVLGSGCVAGDIVYVYALSAFQLNLTPFPSPGALWGLTMSTAGASTTLSVAKGSAADSTNTTMMQLLATMAKTTSAWASGTGNGGLDTGAIAASTWYHWFLIFNPTTLAVDVVFSATATPASGPTTLPTGFTLFRRIGAMKTNGSSQWTSFTQYNDDFFWATAIVVTSPIPTSTEANYTLAAVPTGVRVQPFLHVNYGNSAPGALAVHIRSPDLQSAEAAPSADGGTTSGTSGINANSVSRLIATLNEPIYTNTSAQVTIIASSAGTFFVLITAGWKDDRGKLS